MDLKFSEMFHCIFKLLMKQNYNRSYHTLCSLLAAELSPKFERHIEKSLLAKRTSNNNNSGSYECFYSKLQLSVFLLKTCSKFTAI